MEEKNFGQQLKRQLKMKKKAIIFLLILSFNLGGPQMARAQFVTSNPIQDAKAIGDKVKDIFSELKTNAGRILAKTLSTVVINFLSKFAYDAADWVASGDFTQGPQFVTGAYWKNAADEAAGDAIEAFGKNTTFFQQFGIDLCAPPEPNYQLKLKLQMANMQRPVSRCRFSEIKKAYARMGEPGYWDKVGVGFEPGQNGLSMGLMAQEAVGIVKQGTFAKQMEESQTKGEATPKTAAVSGQAASPKAATESAMEATSPQKASEQKKTEAERAADQLAEGDFTALSFVGKMFLNTLSDKLQKKLLNLGLLSVGKIWRSFAKGKGEEKLANPEAQVVGMREAIRASLADLKTPSFAEVEDYPFRAELVSDCFANPTPYCGALDSSFDQVLGEADAGKPLTVEEAVEKSYLRGEWRFLPPGSPCEKQAYCYQNLVKLRFFRIIPIGWEWAAKIAQSENKIPTLNELLKDFYVIKSPYYHLVDPNWLLKAPNVKCGAEVYGVGFLVPPQENVPGERVKYCADVEHCVDEDSQTGICNSWGYCLREKNIWRLGGNACDSQFNTCATYIDGKGQSASYLANTIDKGICSADNVGCRAFAANSLKKGSEWQWQTNAPLYFSAKAEQCGAEAEGCSKFERLAKGVAGENLVLKKAPAYYNCYGENLAPSSPADVSSATLSSSTLQWAVNKADIYKIFNSSKFYKEECARFASVCSQEEAGCELYTPQNGDPAVPGILTSIDQCPEECAGYETYQEQPISQFSSASLNYFIPSTAKACTAEQVGCEEFVSLEAQAAGGETKEYYSFVKICSKDEAEGAAYYTWEGSDTTGYQLKSFNLKKGTALGGKFDNGKGEPPVYNIAANDKQFSVYLEKCNADKYAIRAVDPSFDPDCREFYDKDGNKSYRLLSKTITVSPSECQTVRKTVSESGFCATTGGAWNAEKGFCTYLMIPQEAKACPAAAAGCRAYRGNAGNNFHTIYQENFDSGAAGALANATGWTGAYSAESIVVGGKSLKANGSTQLTFSAEKGKTYLLSFWAKGDGKSLKVSFLPGKCLGQCPPTALLSQDLPLSSDWRTYSVGPFTVDWEASVASTTIKMESGNVFFLDNAIGKVMEDNIYKIKDSWQTPVYCDNVLGDFFGESAGGSNANPLRLAPQAQLGCEKYTNRQGAAVAVKSFTNLCRREAVGCEEITDTFNTATAERSVFNAFCQLPSVNKTNQPAACLDKNDKTLCEVAPGKDKCRFDYTGAVPAPQKNYSIGADKETIEIPADRKVYLVNDKSFYCAEENLGCRALGPLNYDKNGNPAASSTVYLKNQPEKYDKILCEKEAEGCEKFTAAGGGETYFKDPVVFGNKICEWKDRVSEDYPAGGWVVKGTDKSCYPGIYNIWRVNDPGYDKAVGLCPAEQSGCGEFIDPEGTSGVSQKGQSYYVIDNGEVDRGSCQGQASLQKGCVLFNETAKGSLLWNAVKTYDLSKTQNFEKVAPVNCATEGASCGNLKNDANVILKVKRDRSCGLWLACSGSMDSKKDGQPKEICTELKECVKAASKNDEGAVLRKCAQWAKDEDLKEWKDKDMKKEKYESLNTGEFSSQDWSGYALPDSRQISDLEIETLKSDAEKAACRGFASADAPADAQDPDKYCSFAKITYSGGMEKTPQTFYHEYNKAAMAEGVCDSGYDENGKTKKGLFCVADTDCRDERLTAQSAGPAGMSLGGVCMSSKQISRAFGWPGYCLLKDPATKGCVEWYPLQVPSGEINVNELNQTAGYFPPEGSGRYWCAQAKGNANRSNGGGYRLTTRSLASLFPNTGCEGGEDCQYEGKGEDKYSLKEVIKDFTKSTDYEEMSFSDKYLTNAEKTLHYSEIVAIGLKPLYWFDGKDWPTDEIFIFLNQRLAGIQNGGGEGNDGYYWSGPLKRIGQGDLALDLVWRAGKSSNIEMSFEGLDKKRCEDFFNPNDSNGLAIRFVFAKDSGLLKEIKSKECDGSPDNGGFKADLNFYLTEVCADIRQVAREDKNAPFGLSAKPRTDRIWEQSQYTVGGDLKGKDKDKVVPLNLPYNQLFPPFGSFNQSADPITSTLSAYWDNLGKQGQKSEFEALQVAKRAGYWPIWLAPGGATPLNCEGENGGNCVSLDFCLDGPYAGAVCDSKNENGFDPICRDIFESKCEPSEANVCINPGSTQGQSCHSDVECNPALVCGAKHFCTASEPVGIIRTDYPCNEDKDCEDNYDKFNDDYGLPKSFNPKCVYCEEQNQYSSPNKNLHYCGVTAPGSEDNIFDKVLFPPQKCKSNQDCSAKIGKCGQSKIEICQGGPARGMKCSNDDKCNISTGTRGEGNNFSCLFDYFKITSQPCKGFVAYPCGHSNYVRGLCVGGLNHNLACGSAKDCPPKKYTGPLGETVENGVCVGSSLEPETAIPPPAGYTGGDGFSRLWELFAQSFGTWKWIGNDDVLPEAQKAKEAGCQKNAYCDTGTWAASGWSKMDCSSGGSNECHWDTLSDPKNAQYNPAIANTPRPPVIYSLKEDKTAPAGFTWGQANSFIINKNFKDKPAINGVSPFAATLDFFAYADNDQMPITRVAVDWGDGSPAYEVRGWFKN
ncbi:MAG: hypothetical protein HY982_02800, partial [Candidatus Magasanikbacteria bacterium]|nr:hypothetical protein [Candidatus Magasanikbacteria bacterium]